MLIGQLTRRVMFVALSLVCVRAAAVDMPALDRCTEKLVARAYDASAGMSASWHQLYKHHRKFGACDDGFIAAAYSEAVVRLLADNWDRLSELGTLAKSDPSFAQWALRHIDATTSADDLKKVMLNATGCTDALCTQVRQRAAQALAEIY